jgi:DNA-binding MarR family transcriptional regulator
MGLDDVVKFRGYGRRMAWSPDRQAASLGQGLVRLAFAVDTAYERAGRDLGLTAQQCALLCAVGFDVDADGRWVPAERGTPVGKLAVELHCDQSNASRLVDRAVKRGLLARRHGADTDGRVTLVELTSEGRRRLDRFVGLLAETIDPPFADWSPERRRGALEVLNALADTLETAGERRSASGGRAA